MQYIKNYRDLKTELELIQLQQEKLREQEKWIQKEYQSLNVFAQSLKNILHNMDKKLKELHGIKNSLLYEILVEGTSITQAVDKIAFRYDKDVSTIWKNYYPEVKKKIQEIQKES